MNTLHPAYHASPPSCLSLLMRVCVISLLRQSPWMPATHRAISHKFSEPCKHNIYLSATLSSLLYVAVRNPRRRGAATSELHWTPLNLLLPDPRGCQTYNRGGKKSTLQAGNWKHFEKENPFWSVNTAPVQSINTPTCTHAPHSPDSSSLIIYIYSTFTCNALAIWAILWYTEALRAHKWKAEFTTHRALMTCCILTI